MNIYPVHRNPSIAASSLCDAHLSMQIQRSEYILSLAQPNTERGLDNSRRNDWITWAKNNQDNYEWICWYGLTLCFEYEERFGEVSPMYDAIVALCGDSYKLPMGSQTPFARIIREYPQLNDLTEWPNTVLAYRAFYMLDKKPFAQWSEGRTPPAWWNPDFTLEVTQ